MCERERDRDREEVAGDARSWRVRKHYCFAYCTDRFAFRHADFVFSYTSTLLSLLPRISRSPRNRFLSPLLCIPYIGDRNTETAFNAAARQVGVPPFDLGEKSPAFPLPCHERALQGMVDQLNRACVMKAQHRWGKSWDWRLQIDIQRIKDNEFDHYEIRWKTR